MTTRETNAQRKQVPCGMTSRKAEATAKQVPCGNDNQQGRGNDEAGTLPYSLEACSSPETA